MGKSPPYPPIEPTNFDLIVVGTGVPESIIAAAASTAGKTVLHLDPNPFYGSHFSSLPLDQLTSFLQTPSSHDHLASDGDFVAVDLHTRPMYSDVQISSHSELSGKFTLDLGGPRVFYCADSAIGLMLKSGLSQYMEFKSIEAIFVCDGNGKLLTVPDSREAIFKDQSLGLIEKNRLRRFFNLVQEHLGAGGSDGAQNSESRIPEDELESPFAEFLDKIRLPPRIKSIILYAIAMADHDQDNLEVCKDVLSTKDGIDRLALHHSSVGRFPNAIGAMIYPVYGHELPQIFSRRAAVKGCLQVLRMPVVALLMEEGSKSYKGVKLSSGQDVFSHQLLLDPSFEVPSPSLNSPPDFLQDSSEIFGPRDVKGKVARGICITTCSLKPDALNFLVVLPPKTLYPEQVTSIRVLQVASNLFVCPSGMFVLYLSALCDDATQGKKLLNEAIGVLVSVPISGNPENGSTDTSENTEGKPTLLWSCLYIQELTMGSFGSIISTPMPDGNLNYNDVLDTTLKLFHKMYPHEEFFPETASSDNIEDDPAGFDPELEL
ncbi:rab escort protein 1 isoform X2 [Cornus florida]|uniref:rab escort protein 1 isoform X2 n=1 Tax=Cornus florida TaxID=4283 RepID=UPI00289F7B06|nr:rab escort protein 1 isoform X2 [Cornus florida]